MDGLSKSASDQSASRAVVLTVALSAFVVGASLMGAPAVAQVVGSSAGADRLAGHAAPINATAQRSRAVGTSRDRTPAWSAALNRYGEQQIRDAYDLASRGAIRSAQHGLFEVLRAVAQTLDADQGTGRHRQSLLSAKVAIEEAEDFLKAGPRGTRPRSVAEIAATHRTTLLHGARAGATTQRSATPIVALQLYYSYAVQQFAAAAGGQPVASEVLFALGRVVSLLRDRPANGDRAAVPLVEQKMLLFYRAAWTADPRNHRARNEYGVLLARFNQWPQACRAFEYSVAQKPEFQNTRNLAVAYEHLGEQELAAQARQLSRSLSPDDLAGAASPSGESSAQVAPAVEWVDFDTFAQRGSPAGWSSFAPQAGSAAPARTGTVDSPIAGQVSDEVSDPERAAARSPQPPQTGKRRGLIPSRGLHRLKSVFKRE